MDGFARRGRSKQEGVHITRDKAVDITGTGTLMLKTLDRQEYNEERESSAPNNTRSGSV